MVNEETYHPALSGTPPSRRMGYLREILLLPEGGVPSLISEGEEVGFYR
jgi:hypothetical protein